MVAFTQEQITLAMKRIRGAGDVCMYFIEGSHRAALIDTGYGVGNLKSYIESLTDKPYDVLITHGHVDHAGGAGQFSRVYMNQADRELFRNHCRLEMRKQSLAKICPEFNETLTEEDFAPMYESDFLPLEDGRKFDLGGITLEAIRVPGHTRGIVTILDVEERAIMFGDACGVGTLLCLPESLSIAQYRKSLAKLQEYKPRYDRVLREHGTCESSCRVLEDNIEACERILNGTDDAAPYEFIGKTYLKAFAYDPESGKRLDGREGNIVYSKDKIF